MATETSNRWASRVAAWKASGLTSEDFCKGADFTPGGLRHWAYRLRKTRSRQRSEERPAAPLVKVARVVRVPTRKIAQRAEEGIVRGAIEEPIIVEIGPARLALRRGFDREVLSTALEVLLRLGGAR